MTGENNTTLVTRRSQIEDDVLALVCVWGPMHKDETHWHSVRGVRVDRTCIVEAHHGNDYRWCVFPDGRVMLVRESNIKSHKR